MIYLLLSLNILLFLIFSGSILGTPWIPTQKKNFDRIARLAKMKPGDCFYDLGSGSGELLFHLSRNYGIRCVGIEISIPLYLYSKVKSLLFYNGKVEIRFGDFNKFDLSKADAVYLFLLPDSQEKIFDKLSTEMKEGSRVVVSCWPLKEINFQETSNPKNETNYFLYVKKSGRF